MNDFIFDLKQRIIKSLNLEGLSPADIKDNDPLFGEGLGLDSIDALELIVLLEKEYGARIENPEEAKRIFLSVSTMATFLQSRN
ncbi:MAG TPA: phosphopantetheine-binding protein [Cytophagaceae bacterium]|jgi:acyl carrier protein